MQETSSPNYLSRLPEKARYLGNSHEGQIEIVTDLKQIDSIIENRQRRHKSSNFSDCTPEVGIVLEDEHILVIRDPVKFPSGTTGTYLRILERPELDGPVGVVMLPVCKGEIYLKKVFRHATRRWELELPRGLRSEGLTLVEAVRQEIMEELGYEIESLHELGSICSNTGLLSGTAQSYWVSLKPSEHLRQPTPEASEAFGGTVKLTSNQLLEKVRSGAIRDSFTLSTLQLAQAKSFLLASYEFA